LSAAIFSFPTDLNEFRLTDTATLLKNGTVFLAGVIDARAFLKTLLCLATLLPLRSANPRKSSIPPPEAFTCVGGPGPKAVGCRATMTHTRTGHTAILLAMAR
jgi:hypothetical protein